MDRNYFLSYSRIIALLLLLPVIGKLNTKAISNTMDGFPEVLHCTDIHNYYNLQTHMTKNFVMQTIHTDPDYKTGGLFTGIDSKRVIKLKRFPVVNDNFSVLFQKNINEIRNWHERMYTLYPESLAAVLPLQGTHKFNTPSSTLVDGFQFIIKIPDKYSVLLNKYNF